MPTEIRWSILLAPDDVTGTWAAHSVHPQATRAVAAPCMAALTWIDAASPSLDVSGGDAPASPRLYVSAWTGVMDQRQLPLHELIAACREESRRFRRREPAGGAFGHELIRRAIHDRNDEALRAVIDQYRGLVLAWLRRHPAWAEANRRVRENDEDWLMIVFGRFAAAIKPDQFDSFTSIGAILNYLKACVHSTVIETAQKAEHFETPMVRPDDREVLDDQADPDPTWAPEVTTISQLTGQELWHAITAETRDEAERVVAHQCLMLDVKPGVVQPRYPDLFATVWDVYRVKRNLIERLRRSPAIRRFLGADEPD